MHSNDDFIHINLNTHNIDRYYHRTSILRAIEKNLDCFKGKLLDTGCGKMPYRNYILENTKISEYVGLDIETAKTYDDYIKPDVTWNGKKMPFDDNSFDCILATEVLEHVPKPDIFLSEVFRVLKKGAPFFFTTPFLWPLHEPPYDEYRYTPFSMKRILTAHGFSDINVEALGGWNASLGQMIGLWVRRSPMRAYQRRILKMIAFPILKYLYKNDDPKPDFFQGPMITGISGIAYKH